MSKTNTIAIHCPEESMALDLVREVPSSYSTEELLKGWPRYKENTCYGIQGTEELELIFFGSIDDAALKDATIIDFPDWKKQNQESKIRKLVTEQVYVYMCLGDIQDSCQKHGIKVTKNRQQMESKLIEAMTKAYMEKII